MKRWSVWFVSLWPMFIGCHDSIGERPVPAGYVSYSCTLSTVNIVMGQGDPQTPLESPGGYVRCYDKKLLMANESWGTGGLLLVHGFEASAYYAYDLACPYCYAIHSTSATKLHRLKIAADGQTAHCDDCGSDFGAIFWGSPAPTAGPANENNYPLRQYRASLVGDRLVVTN